MPKGAETELMDKWKVAGRRRNLWRPPLGEGIFRQSTRPATSPSSRISGPTSPSISRRSSISCRPAASSCPSSCASPTSCATASARFTTPFRRRSRVRIRRRLLLRLPDQGQPAAARRRGDPRLRQGVSLRSGGRLQAGIAGRAGPDQRPGHADHLQRLQGRRIHPHGHAGPQDRQADHPRRREVHRVGADRAPRRGPEGPAGHRRARQAGGAGPAAGAPAPATAPSSA